LPNLRVAVDIGGTFTDLVLAQPTRTISKKLLTTHDHPDAAVIEGTRKATAAPFEIGKHAVPPLGAQRVETLSEEALVIHAGPPLVAVILAEGNY